MSLYVGKRRMTSIHDDDRVTRQKLDQILVRLQHLEQRAGLVDETAS